MLAGPNGIAGAGAGARGGARPRSLPVMVHIGGTPFGLEEVVDRLRPGDIVTHAFTGWQPGASSATTGGSWRPPARPEPAGCGSTSGHGAGSFTWRVAEAALADDFRPDSISTDLHRFNVASPVHDLATTMSKFLLLGLSARRGHRDGHGRAGRDARDDRPASAPWPSGRRPTSRSCASRRAGSTSSTRRATSARRVSASSRSPWSGPACGCRSSRS